LFRIPARLKVLKKGEGGQHRRGLKTGRENEILRGGENEWEEMGGGEQDGHLYPKLKMLIRYSKGEKGRKREGRGNLQAVKSKKGPVSDLLETGGRRGETASWKKKEGKKEERGSGHELNRYGVLWNREVNAPETGRLRGLH